MGKHQLNAPLNFQAFEDWIDETYGDLIDYGGQIGGETYGCGRERVGEGRTPSVSS